MKWSKVILDFGVIVLVEVEYMQKTVYHSLAEKKYSTNLHLHGNVINKEVYVSIL